MMTNERRNHAEEIRRSLKDPFQVVKMLGITKGALRNSQGAKILCPVHAERTPSCSVTVGREGTLSAHCFGCNWTGDVLSLVAAVLGLDVRRDFRNVMIAAAERGGLHEIAAELRGERPANANRPMPDEPEVGAEREYPPLAEVERMWGNARPVSEDAAARAMLELRGLQPGPDLARVISGDALPRWASWQRNTWIQSGHRIIMPMFDHLGAMRSLRAWQVDVNAATPKRLPATGHRSTGLVLANEAARRWLREPSGTIKLLIYEGEPDHVCACQLYPSEAIVGVVAGSWTEEFSLRVPFGSEATIRTHTDDAGNGYAEKIAKTLSKRACIKRGAP